MTLEQKLEDNGWFPLVKWIDAELRKKFANYLIAQEGDVKILFSTGGGEIIEALRMAEFIKFHREIMNVKVKSFVLGDCSSAGLTILSECDAEFREASPYAQFWFHSAACKPLIKHNLGLENALESVRKTWQWAEKTIEQESAGFNLTKEKIMELRNFGEGTEYNLTSEEMVSLGIIKSIKIIPTF